MVYFWPQLTRLGWLAHLSAENQERRIVDAHALISSANSMKALNLEADKDSSLVKLNSESHAPERPDTVTAGNDPEGILSNAARKDGLYFSVPKLINQEVTE